MDQSQSSQSASAPGAAPVVLQPFAIPAGMTADQAQARLDELKADKEFGRRWLEGGNDSREGREIEALTRHALGAAQPEAGKVQTPTERAQAGLEPPETPEGYKLTDNLGRPLKMDEASTALVSKTLLPAAHSLGLSQSDVQMVAAQVLKPCTEEQCEASLKRLWGKDYDARVQDFGAAMAAMPPHYRELLEQYPEQLGNNPMLISSIVAAYRRKQTRQRAG